MGAVAFNTYDFVKSLEDAGMDEKHAAAISAGILRAHEVADLATKADVRESQAQTKADLQEVKADLQEVKAQTKADLSQLQAQTKADLSQLQAQTKADLQEMKAQTKADLQEVKADLQEVKADLREMELRIDKKLVEMKGESMLVRWMLGLIMAGIAGLIIKTFF